MFGINGNRHKYDGPLRIGPKLVPCLRKSGRLKRTNRGAGCEEKIEKDEFPVKMSETECLAVGVPKLHLVHTCKLRLRILLYETLIRWMVRKTLGRHVGHTQFIVELK
jgi:hypothetical protein